MMGSETRKQNSCSFIVQRPAGNAVGCDGSFLYIAYTRKNELFAPKHLAATTSPRLKRITTQLREYAPLS